MMLCFGPKVDDRDLPLVPPRRGDKLYMVPQGIRPVVQLTAIEVRHRSAPLIPCTHLYMIRQEQPNPSNFCCCCIFSLVKLFLPFTFLLPIHCKNKVKPI